MLRPCVDVTRWFDELVDAGRTGRSTSSWRRPGGGVAVHGRGGRGGASRTTRASASARGRGRGGRDVAGRAGRRRPGGRRGRGRAPPRATAPTRSGSGACSSSAPPDVVAPRSSPRSPSGSATRRPRRTRRRRPAAPDRGAPTEGTPRMSTSRITTHVLDAAPGRPAAGVAVELLARDGDAWRPIAGGAHRRRRPDLAAGPRRAAGGGVPAAVRHRRVLRRARRDDVLPGGAAHRSRRRRRTPRARSAAPQPVRLLHLSRELSHAEPAIVLGANQYGKAEVRVVKVTRDTARHEIDDLNVTSQLRGDFAAAHLAGDNATSCPPTRRRTRSSRSPATASDRPRSSCCGSPTTSRARSTGSPAAGGRPRASPGSGSGWTSGGRARPRLRAQRTGGAHRGRGRRRRRSARARRAQGAHGAEDDRVGLRGLPEGPVHDAARDPRPHPRHGRRRALALSAASTWTTTPPTRRARPAPGGVRRQLLPGAAGDPVRDGQPRARAAPRDRRDPLLAAEQAPLPRRPRALRARQPERGLLRGRPPVRPDRGGGQREGVASPAAAWEGIAGFC